MTNLTKQEINLRIAKLLYPKQASQWYDAHLRHHDYFAWETLMPLVVKHGISLEKVHFGEDTPYFVARDFDLMVANKDPQITLALCLLKVLEDKEKDNG